MVTSTTSSSASSPVAAAWPFRAIYERVGLDPDDQGLPQLFYDTSDESDVDPTGLLTPVSVDLDQERAWQRERDRYRQERQLLRHQHREAARAAEALAAREAKAGVYMRTRAGIFRNEKELAGWDGCFCHLDSRGRIEITETVWAYVMRHLHPDTTFGPNCDSSTDAGPSDSDGAGRVQRRPVRKLPKASRGKIRKAWRTQKPQRRLKIDIPAIP